MKIARRITNEGDTDFVVRESEGEFVSVKELGFDVRSTADLASVAAEISEALLDVATDGGRAVSGSAVQESSLTSPVTRGCDVICVGLNYAAHVVETRIPNGDTPYLFAKWSSSIAGPYDDIPLDDSFTHQLDYEVELGVVIGSKIERGQTDGLLNAILGYTVANDVSARDVQFAEGNWSRAKSAKGFLPVGPWITEPKHLSDAGDLEIKCSVNDDVRQMASTAQMIFTVEDILSFAASTMELHPGDLILTGTPSGVALGMNDPKWLMPGDTVECEIGGLGALRNNIRKRIPTN